MRSVGCTDVLVSGVTPIGVGEIEHPLASVQMRQLVLASAPAVPLKSHATLVLYVNTCLHVYEVSTNSLRSHMLSFPTVECHRTTTELSCGDELPKGFLHGS